MPSKLIIMQPCPSEGSSQPYFILWSVWVGRSVTTRVDVHVEVCLLVHEFIAKTISIVLVFCCQTQELNG